MGNEFSTSELSKAEIEDFISYLNTTEPFNWYFGIGLVKLKMNCLYFCQLQWECASVELEGDTKGLFLMEAKTEDAVLSMIEFKWNAETRLYESIQ